ncbi:unnamed protein product [Strongylus vulgaris]|uniref:CW-type domain-containing protein n=1 Tax=Strongylus vulgaris TaxID=40348 RepID=A0A3P7JP73_STRVU|nr:unnamed protein product [Strongylus vulgaris]
MRIGHTIQCDKCLKWRHVEYHAAYEANGIPEDWCCDNHPNSMFRGCSRPEEPPKVKEGKLNRQKSPDPPVKNSSSANRNVDRKPELSRSTPTATTNGSSTARRPLASQASPVSSSSSRSSREVQRRAPSPQPSKPLKRSSRVAQRKEASSSESEESSPERPPPRKAPNRTPAFNSAIKASERVSAVGKPPTKRAAALAPKRRIVSSEESDEDESYTVPDLPKKPKTKADLRKQYEEIEKKTDVETKKPTATVDSKRASAAFVNDVKPSSSNTSVKQSPSSTSIKPAASIKQSVSSTSVASPASLSNGTTGKGVVDKELVEKEKERADRAMAQTRKLLNFFVKQGVSFAERFRRMNDEELLEQDMEQFGRNTWEEHVLKVIRERDELRLLRRSDKEQMRKLCEDEFRSELTIILKWAMVRAQVPLFLS